MQKFIIRRLLSIIPTILGVSLVVFFMIHLAPGDPVTLMVGDDATPADIARIQAIYGFDQPLHIQYLRWFGNAIQGDFGVSIRQSRPVMSLIWERAGATVELAFMGMFIALLISIPLGVLSAIRRGSWIDIGAMTLALIGISMPRFWVGLMLLIYVGLNFDFFPLFGREGSLFGGIITFFTTLNPHEFITGFRYLLLPAFALGTAATALQTRLMRSSMLEVLQQDYVRTAKSKGLSDRVVTFKHAFRNALLPVVTIVGLQFGYLLAGAVVVETVFSWPGVARLIINAVSQRDFPIVQAGTLLVAISFALINLIVDISYGFLNPKIRYD